MDCLISKDQPLYDQRPARQRTTSPGWLTVTRICRSQEESGSRRPWRWGRAQAPASSPRACQSTPRRGRALRGAGSRRGRWRPQPHLLAALALMSAGASGTRSARSSPWPARRRGRSSRRSSRAPWWGASSPTAPASAGRTWRSRAARGRTAGAR